MNAPDHATDACPDACPDMETIETLLERTGEADSDAALCRHVERCPRCSAAVKDLVDGAIWAALLQESRREIPPDVRQQLISAAWGTTATEPSSHPL